MQSRPVAERQRAGTALEPVSTKLRAPITCSAPCQPVEPARGLRKAVGLCHQSGLQTDEWKLELASAHSVGCMARKVCPLGLGSQGMEALASGFSLVLLLFAAPSVGTIHCFVPEPLNASPNSVTQECLIPQAAGSMITGGFLTLRGFACEQSCGLCLKCVQFVCRSSQYRLSLPSALIAGFSP